MTNSTGKTPKSIYCGSTYTMLLMTDGTVYGIGDNQYGQLGLGNTANRTTLTALSGTYSMLANQQENSITTTTKCNDNLKELKINELNNELKNKQLELNNKLSILNDKERDLLNVKNTLTLKEADFNKISGSITALEKQNKEMQESLVKKNELIKSVNDNIKQTQDKLNDYISQRDALNRQLN